MLDGERPARQIDFSLTFGLDVRALVLEQVRHVRRLARRADCDHRSRVGYLTGGGENGGSAEAVTDEQLWRTEAFAHGVGGAYEIRYVAREVGVRRRCCRAR